MFSTARLKRETTNHPEDGELKPQVDQVTHRYTY